MQLYDDALSRVFVAFCTSHAKGYTLGEPLPYQPCSIRTLSPVAAVVMRALVHAVLLWTSCNKEDVCIRSYKWNSACYCPLEVY